MSYHALSTLPSLTPLPLLLCLTSSNWDQVWPLKVNIWQRNIRRGRGATDGIGIEMYDPCFCFQQRFMARAMGVFLSSLHFHGLWVWLMQYPLLHVKTRNKVRRKNEYNLQIRDANWRETCVSTSAHSTGAICPYYYDVKKVQSFSFVLESTNKYVFLHFIVFYFSYTYVTRQLLL